MYKLREAKYEDYAAIATLNNSSENCHLAMAEDKLVKGFFEKKITEEDRRLYLVENAGNVTAFILFRLDSTSNVIYIEKLSIDQDYVKKGLDEHLYQKVERIAGKKGVKRLLATITTDNPVVHDFFQRKGWKQDDGSIYVLNK